MSHILNKIRLAFADVRFMFSKVPEVVRTLRKAPEKKILRAKLHQMTDVVVDTYGDLALAIAEKVDFKLLENIITDAALLVAKYQEPLKEQGKSLGLAFQETIKNSSAKQTKVGDALSKIIERIAKREGWNKWETPSQTAWKAEHEARCEKYREQEKAEKKAEAEKRARLHKTVRSCYTEKVYRMERAMPESEFNQAKYEAHVCEIVDNMMYD